MTSNISPIHFVDIVPELTVKAENWFSPVNVMGFCVLSLRPETSRSKALKTGCIQSQMRQSHFLPKKRKLGLVKSDHVKVVVSLRQQVTLLSACIVVWDGTTIVVFAIT